MLHTGNNETICIILDYNDATGEKPVAIDQKCHISDKEQ